MPDSARYLESEADTARLFLSVCLMQGLKYSWEYRLGFVVERGRKVEPAHEEKAADYLRNVRWLMQNWHRHPESDLTRILKAQGRLAYLHVRRDRVRRVVGSAQALDGQFAERGVTAPYEGASVVLNRSSGEPELEPDDTVAPPVPQIDLVWGTPIREEKELNRSDTPDDGASAGPAIGIRPYAFQRPAFYPADVVRRMDVRAAIDAERRRSDHDPRDLSALWLRVQLRWSWEAIAKHPACLGLTPEGARKRVSRLMDRLARRLREYAPVERHRTIPSRGSHRRRFADLAYIERAIAEGLYSQRADGEVPTGHQADRERRDRAFKSQPVRWAFYAPNGTFMHEQTFEVLTKYDLDVWAWDPQDPGLPVEAYLLDDFLDDVEDNELNGR